MTNNILSLGALLSFDQKAHTEGTKMTAHHEMVIEGLTTHFFPLKFLNSHNRLVPAQHDNFFYARFHFRAPQNRHTDFSI